MFFKYILFLATVAGAQRPVDTPICDFYASKIFGNNTAISQLGVMTLILNTAIIGNYTSPNVGVPVTGVAPISTYNGTSVDLLKYFDAALYSSNDGVHPYGVAKNFLDDGGPVPISMSMASNGNVNSAQYLLLTHVWSYFGVLLNCSLQGKDASFPPYEGKQSMFEVHKYMKIDPYEQGWFVNQITLAAKSIGFSPADTTIWYNTLTGLFSYRCSPPTAIGGGKPELQAMCTDKSCPLAANANCGLYEDLGVPGVANASLAGNYTKTNGTRVGGNSTSNGTLSFEGKAGGSKFGIWGLVAGVLAIVFAF